jgi:hypothetical protein
MLVGGHERIGDDERNGRICLRNSDRCGGQGRIKVSAGMPPVQLSHRDSPELHDLGHTRAGDGPVVQTHLPIDPYYSATISLRNKARWGVAK